MSSAAERHEALPREYLVEGWEEGNVDRLDEFVSEDSTEHNPAMIRASNVDASLPAGAVAAGGGAVRDT